MDSFNKVISFVLGLIVVVVFLAVISGRLNLKNKSLSLGGKSATVTPTQTQGAGIQPTQAPTNRYQTTQTVGKNTAKSIPATGVPTLFLPSAISALLGGLHLRRRGKK